MKFSRLAANVLVALAYAGAFILVYIYFLNPYYEYLCFWLNWPGTGVVLVSVLICVVPALFYRGVRALSSVLAVFIYVLLYVPTVVTFALGSNRSPQEILLVQCTFMPCMVLLFSVDSIIIRNPFALTTRVDLIKVVFFLTLAATMFLVVVYRGNLQFVSFADVYVHRFENHDLGEGLVTRYTAAWLNSVLIPVCLAYGLVRRQYRYFMLGIGSCLVIYMAMASKATIVLPVVYLGMYALLGQGRLRAIFPWLVGGLAVSMCVMLWVPDTDSIWFVVSSLALMRNIGTGGVLTNLYYEYFINHPHTLYTHIGLVQMVARSYPYGDLQVGQVVGQYFFSAEMNANANFWAMDGIAALGLIGVPIITVVCALMFMAMNSVTRGHNLLFVVMCFLPFAASIANVGVLQSLFSGGGLPLMAFFLLHRPEAIQKATADVARRWPSTGLVGVPITAVTT